MNPTSSSPALGEVESTRIRRFSRSTKPNNEQGADLRSGCGTSTIHGFSEAYRDRKKEMILKKHTTYYVISKRENLSSWTNTRSLTKKVEMLMHLLNLGYFFFTSLCFFLNQANPDSLTLNEEEPNRAVQSFQVTRSTLNVSRSYHSGLASWERYLALPIKHLTHQALPAGGYHYNFYEKKPWTRSTGHCDETPELQPLRCWCPAVEFLH